MQKEEWAREKARSDQEVERYPDYLTPSVVENLRESADQKIGELLGYLIEEERPGIEDRARLEQVESIALNIKSHIDQKTHWKQAIFTNVLAWLITIGITAIAIIGLVVPDLAQIIAKEAVGVALDGNAGAP